MAYHVWCPQPDQSTLANGTVLDQQAAAPVGWCAREACTQSTGIAQPEPPIKPAGLGMILVTGSRDGSGALHLSVVQHLAFLYTVGADKSPAHDSFDTTV